MKPNEAAKQLLLHAADEYARIADKHEQMADATRRYAMAMRAQDAAAMVSADEELHSITIDDAKIKQIYNMLAVVDTDWYSDYARQKFSRVVDKLNSRELALAILSHSMQCDNASQCILHKLLEERAKKLAR